MIATSADRTSESRCGVPAYSLGFSGVYVISHFQAIPTVYKVLSTFSCFTLLWHGRAHSLLDSVQLRKSFGPNRWVVLLEYCRFRAVDYLCQPNM